MPFINVDNLSKMIYEYDNGERTVKADPAVLWRRLTQACLATGETWEQLLERWSEVLITDNDSPESRMAKSQAWMALEPTLVQIGRDTLSMKPIDQDGIGATEALVMSTLVDFVTAREKKSSNTETSPSSSESSDGDHPDLSSRSSKSNGSPIPTTTASDLTGASPSVSTVPP